jgi:hypothetical protein
MLYDDDSRCVPAFVRTRDYVRIDEIQVCEHGIHLKFHARHGVDTQYVAFAIVRPTPDLFRTRESAYRLFYRDPGATIEQRSARAMAAYERYLADLRSLLGDASVDGRPVEFGTQGRLYQPLLYLKPPLKLEWRGKTIELRGYVDVFFGRTA